jgi:hypothetical protein
LFDQKLLNSLVSIFLIKASRSFSQTSQDSEDDDQPLAFRKNIKTEVKAEKPVKRKADDMVVDDEDEYASSKKKNKKVKEEKKGKTDKVASTPNGTSPTKRVKKEKKEEEETWKWYVQFFKQNF